ncbi:hypothetical protein BDW68DRAFT_178953 [Aspergillus falconensis]
MYCPLHVIVLQALLALTLASLVSTSPSFASGVRIEEIEKAHAQVQHALNYETKVLSAEHSTVNYMPIRYGKCYYLSKDGYGNVNGKDPYNVLTFIGGDKERPFRVCKSRTSCPDESRNGNHQQVKSGGVFYLWDYKGWLAANTNPDYLATDGWNWFFPSNDGYGNEYVRWKGEYDASDQDNSADTSYVVRLSIENTLGARLYPTWTGLQVGSDKTDDAENGAVAQMPKIQVGAAVVAIGAVAVDML